MNNKLKKPRPTDNTAPFQDICFDLSVHRVSSLTRKHTLTNFTPTRFFFYISRLHFYILKWFLHWTVEVDLYKNYFLYFDFVCRFFMRYFHFQNLFLKSEGHSYAMVIKNYKFTIITFFTYLLRH